MDAEGIYSDPDKAAKLLQDEEIKEILADKKWALGDEVNEILLNANLFELVDDTAASTATNQ